MICWVLGCLGKGSCATCQLGYCSALTAREVINESLSSGRGRRAMMHGSAT
ncbi:hypothetical protein PF005_g31563 [Phytophthora fragariae]|uniref:Uncharacterized protein n=2 Tax=Phytophthora TaxID=4783 RepID=A0A6A3VCC6_9STRA|nr:hypothetical protein PF009_g31641 [Phytophthora fragariae]KAE8958852.1 hypothetical protein PR002_g30737 [Phytophthora rubi]KAE8958230.1 hypothetical protein PF011_g30852 [Phytophthora fragariae]KAE8958981.1 hypothetical protein PR001_g30877 [Phytophthora rubi]KAE9057867.1 hypothetical protein PF010_g31209 [Phytophthora fragariae]